MDLTTLIITILCSLFCGAGVVCVQYVCSKKSRERENARKERELELQEESIKLEKERQRLNDLPNLKFDASFSSPLKREHHIDIKSIGKHCIITKICCNPEWRLLKPHLPHSLNKDEQIKLMFILPKGDPVLTKTFSEYRIDIYISDRWGHKYVFVLHASGTPSSYSILIDDPKLIQER